MFAIRNKVTGEYFRNLAGLIIHSNSVDELSQILQYVEDRDCYAVVQFLDD